MNKNVNIIDYMIKYKSLQCLLSYLSVAKENKDMFPMAREKVKEEEKGRRKRNRELTIENEQREK